MDIRSCFSILLLLFFFLGMMSAFGATPLEGAAASGKLDTVKSLLSQSAKINEVDEDSIHDQ